MKKKFFVTGLITILFALSMLLGCKDGVKTLLPYKQIVGTIIEKECTELGIVKSPATLFLIEQKDGTIYYAGIREIHYEGLSVGDKIEAFVDEKETIAVSKRISPQQKGDYIELVPIELKWYAITKFRILATKQ